MHTLTQIRQAVQEQPENEQPGPGPEPEPEPNDFADAFFGFFQPQNPQPLEELEFEELSLFFFSSLLLFFWFDYCFNNLFKLECKGLF